MPIPRLALTLALALALAGCGAARQAAPQPQMHHAHALSPAARRIIAHAAAVARWERAHPRAAARLHYCPHGGWHTYSGAVIPCPSTPKS